MATYEERVNLSETNLEKKRTGAYSHTKFHKGIISFEFFLLDSFKYTMIN